VHAYNGCEHTLVVTADGRLASFGYNYRGQLGHGNTASEPSPKLVRGLEAHRVVLVSCSYYHSVCAAEGGAVFSFGRNDFGQLGHGDTGDKKVATAVAALHGVVVTSVACGQYHTIVATEQGEAFACGKNDYGQLGMDSAETLRTPTRVLGNLASEQLVQLRCGYYHTIALTAAQVGVTPTAL
jgi:RCC1 and BTB domain-containing protein